MVSEKKKQTVTEIKKLIEKYPVIGMLDLFKMPSKQLQKIRKNLRGKALIKMYKKRLIKLALKDMKGKDGIEKFDEFKAKEPALIFTDMDPFKLFRILKKNITHRYAKENDIAPYDIVIHAGPTRLLAGPAIGELQRIKIPAVVKDGKIHVSKDATILKKNDVITSQIANVLKKLEIQPIEIIINLLCVWEKGIIYEKEVLDVDEEIIIQKIRNAFSYALNLSVNVCYPTKESIKIMLQKAHREGKNLGINIGIFDEGVMEDLIMKANSQAKMLRGKLKI